MYYVVSKTMKSGDNPPVEIRWYVGQHLPRAMGVLAQAASEGADQDTLIHRTLRIRTLSVRMDCVEVRPCSTKRGVTNEWCDLPYDHRERCHYPSEDQPVDDDDERQPELDPFFDAAFATSGARRSTLLTTAYDLLGDGQGAEWNDNPEYKRAIFEMVADNIGQGLNTSDHAAEIESMIRASRGCTCADPTKAGGNTPSGVRWVACPVHDSESGA